MEKKSTVALSPRLYTAIRTSSPDNLPDFFRRFREFITINISSKTFVFYNIAFSSIRSAGTEKIVLIAYDAHFQHIEGLFVRGGIWRKPVSNLPAARYICSDVRQASW